MANLEYWNQEPSDLTMLNREATSHTRDTCMTRDQIQSREVTSYRNWTWNFLQLGQKNRSKVHHRSLNLFGCVIPVLKLTKRLFRYLNLFGCVNLVPKLRNLPYRSSNLFSCVIPVPKLVFKSHPDQSRVNLKTLYRKIIHNFFIWTQMKINFISNL